MTLLARLTADRTLPDRAHYLLLLATAHEDAGQSSEAEQTYHAVSVDRETAEADRTSATIGYARLRMMAAPDEAIAALDAVRPLPAQAWEVDLQRARAEALAGREGPSRLSLSRAWAEAPLAGAEQAAAARVASDMVVAAAGREIAAA